MEPVDVNPLSADQHLELAYECEEADLFEQALSECEMAIELAHSFLASAYNL